MITSLTLENWKSHSSSAFSFGKGTNILLGRMGSGKSSALDALCFALYGTFPKMNRRDQTVENLVSMGSGTPYARVAVEFEKSGQKYHVERKIGKKLSEAEVRLEGHLVQKGPKQTTDYVVAALGVDYELFTRAIYSEQNKIDYLLSLNPRARKAEIDYLLGLGHFDAAREGAQSAAGKLSEQAELFSAECRPEKMAEAERKFLELQQQKQEKESLIAKLSWQAALLSEKLLAKQSDVSALEKSRAEWKQLQTETERQKGALQRLAKECEGKKKPGKTLLDSLEAARKQQEALVASAKKGSKEAQSALFALKSELAVLENGRKLAEGRAKKLSELAAKILELSGGKRRLELEEESSALKADLDGLSESHAALHAEMGELSRAVESLLSAGAHCPVCDSDLSGGKAGRLSSEKNIQLSKKREMAKAAAEKLAFGKGALEKLQKKLQEIAVCDSEMKRLSEDGADTVAIQRKIEEKAGEKTALEHSFEKCEAVLTSAEKGFESARLELDSAQRSAKLFEEMETSSAKLSAAEQKLSGLKFDEGKYELARKESEAMRVEQARSETLLRSEEKQLALLLQMLEMEGNALQGLQQKQELAKKYAQAAQSMAIYKNSLSAVQSELRTLLVDEINQALSEVWPSIYPYGDYAGVRLEADEKDYRLLMQKADWAEVDAIASGGERACLCLALRIAFATVLTPDLSWLILDEPTHNLDSDAVLMLSEAINRKIPSIVEQTFVITHDTALGEAGEGAVFRLERDKSKNESTKIEKLG